MLHLLLVTLFTFLHPFHVSVTEVDHNAKKKTLEISCRLFYDDFERALERANNTQLDIVKPKDKTQLNRYIFDYLKKNLQLSVDGKPVNFTYLGFELDEDAAACYLEVPAIKEVKQVVITNQLMLDEFPDQSNIMHVTVQDWRQSHKLDNPDKKAVFNFQVK